MPTYLYKREDDSTFEIEQRITDPALKECPTTGQSVKRLISPGAGLVFKGSGFYLTDYARKDSGSTASTFPDREKKEKEPTKSSDGSIDSASTDAAKPEKASGKQTGSGPKE